MYISLLLSLESANNNQGIYREENQVLVQSSQQSGVGVCICWRLQASKVSEHWITKRGRIKQQSSLILQSLALLCYN